MLHTLYHITREQLLHDLFVAYKRARQHKACTIDQQQFELNLESELVSLTDELYTRSYKPSAGICFVIHDPKLREVFAANFRDRVVHHLYYGYTHHLFERTFIADTYSCIEGRGTHYGINRLEHHIRSESDNYRKPCYILKIDVKGYFMHINRQKLLTLCMETLDRMRNRKIESEKPWDEEYDYDLVKYLTNIFVLHDPLQRCLRRGRPNDWSGLPPSKSLFFSPEGCGLPIGNLTSQLFSNVYMNRFDQYCKRELNCKHYGRYVDDAYVVSRDRVWLKSLVPKMREYLKTELGLQLHPDKIRVDDCMKGVSFLGAYLKPWRIYVYNDTVRRIRRKIRCIDADRRSPLYVRSAMSSFAGIFSHRCGRRLRMRTLCATNPTLLHKGFFIKDMHCFYLYRSVFRLWYRQLQSM